MTSEQLPRAELRELNNDVISRVTLENKSEAIKLSSRLPSTLSWILRYYLPEIVKIFILNGDGRSRRPNCGRHRPLTYN